ncbi:hypothetical protein AVEN_62083-1 [Araneus ventricosus]|uniref:RNase H type-1 domain-containing protein n=1 Tax=Araneus ventricosus TaxID=182803 RepID=A0A4Y2MY98_ARAVE|nr:hypothetical protein AVEN_62083-1 [Araneus ventricosus]
MDLASSKRLSSLETLCHPVAMEILGLLHTIQNWVFCILFCWIPSHMGIIGNEQADCSGKTAASFLHREILFYDLKKSVASHIFSLCQEAWDLHVHNKLYYIKSSIGLWSVLPIRGADVKLTRLRIGHTRVTHKHLLFGEREHRCAPRVMSNSLFIIIYSNAQILIFFEFISLIHRF